MNPYDAAHSLVKSIKYSSQYKEYLEAREKLAANSRAREMIKDMQKKQFALQQKLMQGQQLTEEEEQQMQKLQEIVLMHDTAREYLAAEHQMMILLADVQKIFSDGIDLGLTDGDGDEADENNGDSK
ncbi:MAG: YlbF family regulator [Halanaerobium sp.]|nr:YlbF family regulator [Halanaerobium sp.]